MNIRPFEIGLIVTFVIAAFAGLFFLSNYKGADDQTAKIYGDKVEVWGTFDLTLVRDYFLEIGRANKAFEVVKYKQIDERNFNEELLNAIADGKAPDLIILPHDLLVTYRSKLQVIPFESLSERTFRDSYVDGADIFMRSDGIYGIPFAVDPLVMYWNKDIFSGSSIALPPKTWETIVSETTAAITESDSRLGITKSAIAFGEYANVAHAKDIMSMLLLQAGSSIVEENGKSYTITLNKNAGTGLTPGDATLSFYTQFALPNKSTYSWNRSLELDKTEFLRGNLALYFGKGSERKELERANPNLNFDIATVPQGSGASIQRNYGDFYAFAIPRASKNIQGAYAVASYLAASTVNEKFVERLDLAPVNRALFSGKVADPFRNVVYQSALISHGWLDPAPEETEGVFRRMIEGALMGQERSQTVIIDAVQELEELFR